MLRGRLICWIYIVAASVIILPMKTDMTPAMKSYPGYLPIYITEQTVMYENEIQSYDTSEQPQKDTTEQSRDNTQEQSRDNAQEQLPDSTQEQSQDDDAVRSQDYNSYYDEIYDIIGMDKLYEELKKEGFEEYFTMEDIISDIKNEDTQNAGEFIRDTVYKVLSKELSANRVMLIELLLIVLLGSVFVNLSTSFSNTFISENGFYITYLIASSILMTSFSISFGLIQKTIKTILVLVRIVVPFYAVAFQFMGYTATGAGMYEVIMVGIWAVEAIILKAVLPVIEFYVIVSLVNNLNKEDFLSKLAKLLKRIVNKILKSIVVFIISINVIKSLLEPQMDILTHKSFTRFLANIPGGGIASALTGTFLSAGLVIKNTLGVSVIVAIVLIAMIPVVKLLIIMLMVRLMAVVVQPIGEKRYVDSIDALANGLGMLLQAVTSSIVLFILTIAMMAYVSNTA